MDNEVFRGLPKIDDILHDGKIAAFKEKLPDSVILGTARDAVNELREGLPEKKLSSREDLRRAALYSCEEKLTALLGGRMRRVINATGVLVHTNLGRAPMPPRALDGLAEMLAGYTNLEYDLQTGSRSRRGRFAERLICGLTGAEDALCVNNNAAALLLVLSTLSGGKEVLLSRGEVVEIGGSFRLTGIISAAGARLVEVGTTNRTRVSDYIENITENTGAIMKAHTSNFRIMGYTESVAPEALAKIGKNAGIPVVYDMGSGVLTDLTSFGLPDEQQASGAIRGGADIITFSGDKLLGGPQAGIIAGRRDIISRVRKNPLYRCVRLDKAALWLLEGCLSLYCESGQPDIPVLKNAAAGTHAKAAALLKTISGQNNGYNIEIIETTAETGGGTLPCAEIKSHGLTVTSDNCSAAQIEKRLRTAEIPVICRVNENAVILDVIAIDCKDFDAVARALRGTI